LPQTKILETVPNSYLATLQTEEAKKKEGEEKQKPQFDNRKREE
jgi:hypothetical protein